MDDNQLTLAWAIEEVSKLGYEVITYHYSFGIHEFIKRHQPHAVFLDVRMPAVNGSVICKKLRDDPKLASLLIFLCSALDRDELKKLATDCGASGYVVKDESAQKMLKNVKIALEAHQ